ncbi:MAG: DUF1707 SHOCT-like domain-containing protein [Streptosporangiaceae bacterium]
MNDVTAQHAGSAVRASDAEREQTVALLQSNFADGRLTQAELEERAGAAYAAQTRAQLRDLTADLPAAQQQPKRSGGRRSFRNCIEDRVELGGGIGRQRREEFGGRDGSGIVLVGMALEEVDPPRLMPGSGWGHQEFSCP